mmetsp:Transcript_33496/g.60391  ORF Transcript_33496/g.60391 Transcript_33496/m.60391 type:complete len:238 (-) Transcript_33496:462-1175(-)
MQRSTYQYQPFKQRATMAAHIVLRIAQTIGTRNCQQLGLGHVVQEEPGTAWKLDALKRSQSMDSHLFALASRPVLPSSPTATQLILDMCAATGALQSHKQSTTMAAHIVLRIAQTIGTRNCQQLGLGHVVQEEPGTAWKLDALKRSQSMDSHLFALASRPVLPSSPTATQLILDMCAARKLNRSLLEVRTQIHLVLQLTLVVAYSRASKLMTVEWLTSMLWIMIMDTQPWACHQALP